MTDYEKTVRLLNALGSMTRLQILELIEKEVSNPGDMAKKLNRHRSTVEKHLRVLLAAGIVDKVPSLSRSGQLTVHYRTTANAKGLLALVKNVSERFNY